MSSNINLLLFLITIIIIGIIYYMYNYSPKLVKISKVEKEIKY